MNTFLSILGICGFVGVVACSPPEALDPETTQPDNTIDLPIDPVVTVTANGSGWKQHDQTLVFQANDTHLEAFVATKGQEQKQGLSGLGFRKLLGTVNVPLIVPKTLSPLHQLDVHTEEDTLVVRFQAVENEPVEVRAVPNAKTGLDVIVDGQAFIAVPNTPTSIRGYYKNQAAFHMATIPGGNRLLEPKIDQMDIELPSGQTMSIVGACSRMRLQSTSSQGSATILVGLGDPSPTHVNPANPPPHPEAIECSKAPTRISVSL